MATAIKDPITGALLEVTTNRQLKVKQANPVDVNGTTNFEEVGSVRLQSEIDAGTKTGSASLVAPYVDQYFRTYISDANTLDCEVFNYTAQNTGKHLATLNTMTNSFTAAGLLSNSANTVGASTGSTFGTRACFSLMGNTNLDCEVVLSFTAQPTTNTTVDFGFFHQSVTTPYVPLDGVYFRLSSAGMLGVINNNGTETQTGVFDFSYINGDKNTYYISVSIKGVQFWINDILYANIETPSAQSQPFMSSAVPFSTRHGIFGGAAGNAFGFHLNSYSIITCGVELGDSLGTVGNRAYGSYQGLSGGTMGSLASYVNNTNPVAAVPTNTTSTVCNGLGGQGLETDTLAAATDGIIMSYQLPVASAIVQGKRLKITGVKISSCVQTALTGGGYNSQFSLCFGHTAVSLATAEAVATKAPRRIALGGYSVPAATVALTQFPIVEVDFRDAPVYINPGEFVAIAKKKVGAAPTVGAIGYMFTLTYSWE